MQFRQVMSNKANEAKQQLTQWYATSKEKMQPMVDHLKLLKLDQWAQIAAIASSSSSAVVSVLEIASRLFSTLGVEEALVRRIVNERESAVNSYKQANQALVSGLHGLALSHIDHAVSEFTETPLSGSQREVWADRQLYAEMLRLKGIIHLTLNQPKEAIHALKAVINIDENALLAHNLLAYLYMQTNANAEKAQLHLNRSYELASKQIFANYYLGKMNNNHNQMCAAVDRLMDVFTQKAISPESADHSQAWLNLQATTLPSMIITLLIDWLDYSAKEVSDPNALATIANMGALLSLQPTEMMLQFSERILEVRLITLDKLAKLKAFSAEFEAIDLDWQQAYGLVERPQETHPNYYIEFSSKSIVATVSAKFESFDWMLLKAPAQKSAMASVIAGWAMHGWLPKLPCFGEIQQSVKALKHLHGNDRDRAYQSLHNLCASPDIISTFLDLMIVSPIRWENIFKATLQGETMHSVLHIICILSNIELLTHVKQDNELTHCSEYSISNDTSSILDAARLNPKTKCAETLCVSYQPENSTLAILEPLNTPNRVYSRIALQDAWSLHEKNPSNSVALAYLNRKGAVYLQQPKHEALALPNTGGEGLEPKKIQPTQTPSESQPSYSMFSMFALNTKEWMKEKSPEFLLMAAATLAISRLKN